ncbi:fused (3R)-hydroxyacyl-ACP dehydratase subunits HadA/HadB [Nocardia sp. CA-129566]|uniref:fused (3R)-hydroxyacyl-ACP dehydratase subunits HadA/HadB n=1 Tax=Nocardia sp. CA-129566 TaxID=3239976 RepID=UPI003D988871
MMVLTGSEQASALVGRHYRMADHYEVGREKIREFARAVRDFHPAHWNEAAAGDLGYDALIAPPTFSAIVWLLVQRKMFDSVLTGYDISQMLHTEQSIKVHRPLVAGDRLRCDSCMDSFRQFGDMDFMVIKTVLTNQHRELLQTAHATVVAQTGAQMASELVTAVDGVIMTGQALTERNAPQHAQSQAVESGMIECFDKELPGFAVDETQVRVPCTKPEFDELTIGAELPTRVIPLSRGDLVNYAGVSGDSNPIHYSDHVADVAGLPNVVSHGLLTMGLGASYLTDWLGDPAAIVDYGVRFSGFAPVSATHNSEIEFRGRIKALDPVRRAATIMLTATCNGRKLFGRAMAEVLLR